MAKAPAKTAEQVAFEAKQKAVNEITKAVPGLANPEKYVGTNNKANLVGAREAYIKENLKLDPAPFKAGNYNIATANKLAPQVNKFKEMGLANAESFINKNLLFDVTKAEESLIKDVYKLNPAEYAAKGTVPDPTKQPVFDIRTGKMLQPTMTVVKYDIGKANQKYQFEQPKIQKVSELEKKPDNLLQALNYYTTALSSAQKVGINNLNAADTKSLKDAARLVRDFKTGNLSQNAISIIDKIGDVESKLNEIETQKEIVKQANAAIAKFKGSQQQSQKGLALEEEKKLTRLLSEASQGAPQIAELVTRVNIQDLSPGIGKIPEEDIKKLDDSLANLKFDVATKESGSKLLGKLNINVTDQQILDDINSRTKAKYDELYATANSIASDLKGQIDEATQYGKDLPAGDRRIDLNNKFIADLQSKLDAVNEDVVTTKGLVDNYKPTTVEEGANVLKTFRESLLLPEQRMVDEIRQIDPATAAMIEDLTKGYADLAKADIGETTDPATEALRRDIQDKLTAQVALGSQLDAEERRQYEQAARGAQTARGNIFGVAPAVEEAVTTGLAGEARMRERLGAASSFLSSGQSVTDALRRDKAFREAATLNRLGAAADFTAAGATMYNMANRRAAEQSGGLAALVAGAGTTTTGTFGGGQTANIPYMYVDPMAGFRGAQNATALYGSEADYLARTYGAYVNAQATTNAANSFPSYLSAGADVLKGAGSLSGTSGFFACWVAREVYGADNPKWVEFREWMFTKASDNLRNFYLKYGERIAESIRNKPKIKSIIRKWMDSKIG